MLVGALARARAEGISQWGAVLGPATWLMADDDGVLLLEIVLRDFGVDPNSFRHAVLALRNAGIQSRRDLVQWARDHDQEMQCGSADCADEDAWSVRDEMECLLPGEGMPQSTNGPS